jgi:hypothetical protein
LADVVGAFGSAELIQVFVGRQSFADEDVRPGRGVGKGGFGAPIARGIQKNGRNKKRRQKKEKIRETIKGN